MWQSKLHRAPHRLWYFYSSSLFATLSTMFANNYVCILVVSVDNHSCCDTRSASASSSSNNNKTSQPHYLAWNIPFRSICVKHTQTCALGWSRVKVAMPIEWKIFQISFESKLILRMKECVGNATKRRWNATFLCTLDSGLVSLLIFSIVCGLQISWVSGISRISEEFHTFLFP